MIRRFGNPAIIVGKVPTRRTRCLASDLERLDIFEGPGQETIRDLEYLRLNGDLYWNQPLPKEILEQHEWHQGDAAPPSEIEAILDAAQRMDVEIPVALINFMSSQESINSMYLGGEYFKLTPKLIECLGCDDKNGEGFIVVFMRDQQDCGFYGLYVAPGGHQCVLGLDGDFLNDFFDNGMDGEDCEDEDDGSQDGESPEDETVSQYDARAAQFVRDAKERRFKLPEIYKNVPLAKQSDYFLLHTDVEEWLVMRYFDMWIGKTWDDICEEEGREFVPSQMEYLRNCWPVD